MIEQQNLARISTIPTRAQPILMLHQRPRQPTLRTRIRAALRAFTKPAASEGCGC